MKEIEPDFWWKPFGTLISCINGKDSQCQKNIEKEQCIDLCEQDPTCQLGYHITFTEPFFSNKSQIKTICNLNTNSYQWANTRPTNSFIPSVNSTKLSSDKGIKVSCFYNEKKYIENNNLPHDFFSYLFSGMNVFLGMITIDDDNKNYQNGTIGFCVDNNVKKNGGHVKYMDENFVFQENQQKAVVLKCINSGTVPFDFQKRILKGSVIQLLFGNLLLTYNVQENRFQWNKSSFLEKQGVKNQYEMLIDTENEDERWTFLNSGDCFHFLFLSLHNTYFNIRPDTFELTVKKNEKPPHHIYFFLEIVQNNAYNDYLYSFFLGSKPTIDPIFASMLPKFLYKNYGEDSTYENILSKSFPETKNSILIGIVFLLLIIHIFLFVSMISVSLEPIEKKRNQK